MILNIIKIFIFILLLTLSFPINYFFSNLIGSVLLILCLSITSVFYLTTIEFLYYLKIDIKRTIKNNFKTVLKSLFLFIPIELILVIANSINVFSSSTLNIIYEFLFKYILTLVLLFTYRSINSKETSENLVIASTYTLTMTTINILYSLV